MLRIDSPAYRLAGISIFISAMGCIISQFSLLVKIVRGEQKHPQYVLLF